MRVEPSASYAGSQDDDTERSGGVSKDEIRAIAIGGKSPVVENIKPQQVHRRYVVVKPPP